MQRVGAEGDAEGGRARRVVLPTDVYKSTAVTWYSTGDVRPGLHVRARAWTLARLPPGAVSHAVV